MTSALFDKNLKLNTNFGKFSGLQFFSFSIANVTLSSVMSHQSFEIDKFNRFFVHIAEINGWNLYRGKLERYGIIVLKKLQKRGENDKMEKLTFRDAIQIRRDTAKVLGREVKYKLYALKHPCACYAIVVTDGKERHARCFGKDKRAALEIYKKIVASTVTPCTLDDIADDFAAERKLIG